MRLTSQEIKDLMKQEGVSRIWSWSKWNCFKTSPYEYYLKYIRHIPEDRADSIYATTGSISHDILERYYTGQLEYNKMIDDFNDGWVTAYDISGLKFDRNDEAHNKKIADKYYFNLCHFFQHHKPIEYNDCNIIIEQFVKAKIGYNLFQGYIDMSFNDGEDVYVIDFKTSSIYKGKKAEQECGQLIIYAIGMNQRGVPFDKIRIGWNFLKYCTIQYQQANGVVKTRDVERCKIGESLQTNAKMWLKKFGYADDIDYFLKQMLDTNGIECLPEEVQEKYSFNDCVVYVTLTQNLVDKWTTDICNQITDIIAREEDYRNMKKRGVDEDNCSKAFWDTDDSVKSQSYYFSTLCGYSPTLHKPYELYLNKLENQKNGLDTFSGVGSNIEYETSTIKDNDNDLDLSWLENL